MHFSDATSSLCDSEDWDQLALEVVCGTPVLVENENPTDIFVTALGSAIRSVGTSLNLADMDRRTSLHVVQTMPGSLIDAAEGENDVSRPGGQFPLVRSRSHETGNPKICREDPAATDFRGLRLRSGMKGGLGRKSSANARVSFGALPQADSGDDSGDIQVFGTTDSANSEYQAWAAGQSGADSMQKTVTMRELGLPSLLGRRRSSLSSQVYLAGTAGQEGQSAVFLQASSSHNMVPMKSAAVQDSTRALQSSILDFEHLFAQYFVEVTPRRNCSFLVRSLTCSPLRMLFGVPRRPPGPMAVPVTPCTAELLSGWKAEIVNLIVRHREACQQRWPLLQLSRKALEKQIELEVECTSELSGPRSRIVLTLEPERVCHRLLWALGDAFPPAKILAELESGLQARWPQCKIRCADDLFHPSGLFQILVLLGTLLLVVCISLLIDAADEVVHMPPAVAQGRVKRKELMLSTREERLDQLAARLLLTGSVAQLVLLHTVAATFPLRSLHSPFQRDLGCLAAYSTTALRLCRLVAPVVALKMPLAMAVRFQRLRLPLFPARGQLGPHTLAFFCALLLPVLTAAAAWSVRSSLYSQHQLFVSLLQAVSLGSCLAFAAYFEMVKWAVFAAAGLVGLAFFLFARYVAEFTNVRLLKAAQLQWAGAHILPVMGLLLAAALEVESGVARAIIDFICEGQDLIPVNMCKQMLRKSST